MLPEIQEPKFLDSASCAGVMQSEWIISVEHASPRRGCSVRDAVTLSLDDFLQPCRELAAEVGNLVLLVDTARDLPQALAEGLPCLAPRGGRRGLGLKPSGIEASMSNCSCTWPSGDLRYAVVAKGCGQ